MQDKEQKDLKTEAETDSPREAVTVNIQKLEDSDDSKTSVSRKSEEAAGVTVDTGRRERGFRGSK